MYVKTALHAKNTKKIQRKEPQSMGKSLRFFAQYFALFA